MKVKKPRFWIDETDIDFDDFEPPIIWDITLFKVSTLGGVTKEMEENVGYIEYILTIKEVEK